MTASTGDTFSFATIPAPARYRIDALCGHGGAGTVYRAWDEELGRHVALKFLRDDRREHRARMLREARAQARIDHPHICRIFDVGEEGDRLYIAMQWVDGERLDLLVPRLSLEEKIAIIRDVASGVQAAHAEGIIHRDLKPANILVERREDAVLHPVVVDFGLARAVDDVKSTATGEVIGTPHYLSPEQAWGLPADRRSDVYSIGATLYELISGGPPFSGETPTELLLQVISRPVKPLQRVVPSVPRDLATITESCLAKEPERRYDSARALRDDLDRWLRGEPIAARRPGIAYRALAALRRHRSAALAVAIATLLTGTVAGFKIIELQREDAQREATSRLEDRVRYIEHLIEHDRGLPLHDTRPAIARAAEEIDRLSSDGELAEFSGPLTYAIGRARLAAGDETAARESLERAWGDGLQTPAVGYHLGIALSNEYARALADAERIEQEELRRARVDELRTLYHEKAILPLRAARGWSEQPAELIEARIAFIEGNDERARAFTERVLRRFPWKNDARLLAAESHLRAGRALRLAGKFQEAREAFEQAQQVYRDARVIAPSDIRILDGICHGSVDLLQLASDAGGDEEPWFEEAQRGCEEALVADPEHSSSWISLSSAWTRIAFFRDKRGRDRAPAQQKAIEAAEHALRLAPDDPAAWVQAGAAYYWMPLEYAPKVTELMRRAVALDPASVDAHHGLGRALLKLTDWTQMGGGDPRSILNEAIGEYREVLRRVPDYVPAYSNLGYTYNHLAVYARRTGADPEPYYREMLAILEPRMKINPEVAAFPHIAGIAWEGIARWKHHNGEGAAKEIQRAETLQSEAIRINPDHVNSYSQRAYALTFHAQIVGDGTRRDGLLEAARADIDWLEQRGVPVNDLDWHLLHARFEMDPRKSLAHLARAERSVAELLHLSPQSMPGARIARARIERVRCRVAPAHCDPDRAEKLFAQAIAENPLLRMDVEMARAE